MVCPVLAMGLLLWVVEAPVLRLNGDHLWVVPPFSVAQAEEHHRVVVASLLAAQAEHHHYNRMAASSSAAVGFDQPELHQPLVALVAADPVDIFADPVARVVGVVVKHRVGSMVARSISGVPEPP